MLTSKVYLTDVIDYGDIMEIKPIAYIYTDFKEKFGIPRQSGRVPALTGRIVFEKEFKNSEAIRGIEGFSHLWLIFGFSKADYKEKTMTVRPPRLGGNKRMGVFATRSPFRPNSLGLSCVKLEKIENGDLIVSGVDLLSNTPIYDVKPYIPYSDCIEDAQGSYAEDMQKYSLDVIISQEILKILPEDKHEAVISCLKEDPRPSYQNDGREYSMVFSDYDIHFIVKEKTPTVTGIDKIKRNC